MDPAVSKSVTVTPAYAYPHDAASDVKVGYTAPLPTVPAMSRTQDTMNKMGIDVTKMEVAEDVKSYKPSITSDMYIKEFKDTTSFSAMKALREKVNAEEHMLRKVYAKKAALGDAAILKEKYPLLVPVFGNEDIFACKALSQEEKSIPKVFELGNARKKAGTQSIVDKKGFETNWRIFTERLLDLVNWGHVFIAGGSILACLLPPPPKAMKNFKCLRKYFHEDVYAGSDIDLFLYGMNEEEGKKALSALFHA